MPTTIPYRLKTPEDVEHYIRATHKKAKGLLEFARRNELVLPPVLGRIPSSFSFVVSEIKRRYQRILSEEAVAELENIQDYLEERRLVLLPLTDNLPPSYMELASVLRMKLLEKGIPGLEKINGNADGMNVGNASYSSRLEDNLVVQRFLTALLKHYLETRSKAIRALVTESLLLMALYDTKTQQPDGAALEHIRSTLASSVELLDALHRILCARISIIQQCLFRSDYCRYCLLAKDKIIRSKSPANFRKNMMDIMDGAIETLDQERAYKKYQRLLSFYRDKLEEREIRRIESHLENFLNKIRAFSGFFEKEFHLSRLDHFHDLFIRKLKVEVVTLEAVSRLEIFTLYPSKDYHDYLKGNYSGDCSSQGTLAAQHLRNPRFFNIRIFRESAWVGNVYALDYTDRNTIIIDRIQLQKMEHFMPVNFFPRFMACIAEHLRYDESIVIVGSPVISNFPLVKKNYSAFTSGRKRIPFSFSPEDSSFECARFKYMYMLT